MVIEVAFRASGKVARGGKVLAGCGGDRGSFAC